VLFRSPALEYYREFFYDAAVNGNTAALACGLSFCGVDRLIFATDMPFDNESGSRLIRETLESIERLNLSEADRRKVYCLNAVKLLKLPVAPF
jgi:aminocarboxymuconate-semialdehyde decarboxylase